MIVSRFAIVTEDLVICCYQVTRTFLLEVLGLPVRFVHGAFVILVLFAYFTVSVFREVCENTMIT